jgi:outer membrane scaffolding protein for murein synthesis (MipA/OmpV family)
MTIPSQQSPHNPMRKPTMKKPLNSGYAAFEPKSGLYEVSASLGWNHQCVKNWTLHTLAAAYLTYSY